MSSQQARTQEELHVYKKRLSFDNVPLKLEALSGMISGFVVSPFNTIVDKSIIENSNGKMPLWKGVGNGLKDLFSRPLAFLSTYEFRWIFFVYSATYVSSNLADHWQIKGVDPAIVKLMTTFTVNTITSIVKDKALTQRFGATEKRSFPLSAIGLFFIRDIFAMASAFTIPTYLGEFISDKTDIDRKNGLRIAQIISPLLIQFVATPIHLLGLDMYNNLDSSFSDRIRYLRKVYFNSLVLRMLRFLPAYGLGGIANIEIRNYFQEKYSVDQKL